MRLDLQSHKRFTLLLALLAVGGCAEDIPANPTWLGEVEDIMISNCGRCHGPYRPEEPGNVPPALRLDLYRSDDDAVLTISSPGVQDRIRARAIDYETNGESQMPPDSYLTNDQKETLERWLDDGAPLGD